MHCNANVPQFCSLYQYFYVFSSVFLSSRRIDFFVVCIAMQMFPNSVQSESILILGKFSPAERGGREQRGNLGYGEKLKVKGEMGERGKGQGEMGKR